jgi:hypothetical protein
MTQVKGITETLATRAIVPHVDKSNTLIDQIQSVAIPAIENTDRKLATGPSILNQAGLPSDFVQKVSVTAPEPLTDIAYDFIRLGLKSQGRIHQDISRYIDQAEEHQKTIGLLLDFQSELSKNPQNQTPKMAELIGQLKEKGIEMEFAKDRISELKSLASAQVDKKRSEIQIIFTTKLQVKVQHMGSINDILKDIIRYNSRLLSTITGNQAKR